MTKKELSQLYYLKKEIAHQQSRIAELEALATNCTAKITGLPHSTEFSDKVGINAAGLADLKSMLEKHLKKCVLTILKINNFIQSIDDPLIRMIITHRYINRYSWKRTAREIGGGNTVHGLIMSLNRFLES